MGLIPNTKYFTGMQVQTYVHFLQEATAAISMKKWDLAKKHLSSIKQGVIKYNNPAATQFIHNATDEIIKLIGENNPYIAKRKIKIFIKEIKAKEKSVAGVKGIPTSREDLRRRRESGSHSMLRR